MTGIRVEGLGAAKHQLAAASELFGRPTPLLKAWSVVVLQRVAQAFQQGGIPGWKPLASSTVAARRAGKGARGTQALANTGAYRRSWDATASADRAVIYSDSPIAPYHEYGTRGPYEIRPRRAKALALPFLPGRDTGRGTAGTGKAGRYSLEGLRRGKATGRGSFKVPAVGTRVPYSNVAFRMRVSHPGLTARPVLPTPAEITPVLVAAGERFLTQAILRRSGLSTGRR